MVVIGVDPGTENLGYAVRDTITDAILESGTLRWHRGDAFERTQLLVGALKLVLEKHSSARVVAVERMFVRARKGAAGDRAARSLGNVVFAIRQAATEFGMTVVEIPTATARLRVVGRGNATKADVQTYLRLLGIVTHTPDEADAVCIALAYEPPEVVPGGKKNSAVEAIKRRARKPRR